MERWFRFLLIRRDAPFPSASSWLPTFLIKDAFVRASPGTMTGPDSLALQSALSSAARGSDLLRLHRLRHGSRCSSDLKIGATSVIEDGRCAGLALWANASHDSTATATTRPSSKIRRLGIHTPFGRLSCPTAANGSILCPAKEEWIRNHRYSSVPSNSGS